MTTTRRTFVLSLAATAAGARAEIPVDQQDLAWRSAGGRLLPALVRWPLRPAGPGGWPVIVYSHGLGGSRQGGALWGDAWARAGFVVVHLQHVGSDVEAVRRLRSLQGTAGPQQLLERLQDVRAALDELDRLQATGGGMWAQMRPGAYGLAGHSFGAHTTLGMAGQAYPGMAPIDEPRLVAFVALSPTVPQGDARAAFAAVRKPVLCVTGTEDGDVVGNGATPERRRATFDALPAGHKALLLLQDADHMTFGGTPRAALPWQRRSAATTGHEQAHQALVAAITTDWWRAWLQGDGAAQQRLKQPAGLAPGDAWTTG